MCCENRGGCNLTQQFSDRSFTSGVVLAFLLLGFIGVFNHEIRRDEAQAWLIAIHSPSLPALFEVLRYEGHPGAIEQGVMCI